MENKRQQTIYVTEEEEKMVLKLQAQKLIMGQKTSISNIYSEVLRDAYRERIGIEKK